MYSVSQEYKDAMALPYKTRRLRGRVGNVQFTEDNVSKGSLTIDNQCASTDGIRLGNVTIGKLVCTFRGLNINGWRGKIIYLAEELDTGFGWESVPLGCYIITEAVHREDGMAVEAYDYMRRLKKKYQVDTTGGNLYDWLDYISTACNVELAQTKTQILALPNARLNLRLPMDVTVETHWDLLSWLAQTCACFATIDRYGCLVLKTFEKPDNPVDTITADDRWTGTAVSDFDTSYTEVTLELPDDDKVVSKCVLPNDGTSYNMGANPFLQKMRPIDRELAMGEIVLSISKAVFRPFQVHRSAYPAYDLGDFVILDQTYGDDAQCMIMGFEYQFHGDFMIEGYGSNPEKGAATSSTDKQLANLIHRDNVQNKIQIYKYQNIKQYYLNQYYREVISIRFGSVLDTLVTFQAEIHLEVETESTAVLNVQYVINGNEETYSPSETYIDGHHILSLFRVYEVAGEEMNSLSVKLNITGGTATIDRMNITASVSGQGLASVKAWDGEISLEDEIAVVDLMEEPEPLGYDATADVSLVDTVILNFAETVPQIGISEEPDPMDYNAAPYINKRPLKELTWGEVKEYTWGEILELFDW